ncbi:cupin domain-containing protein [Actinacidiphila acididurans]|uniref:Cupin domain-containing protein n=1 Tax=Actinacidiphila acididurans TaxID=2784346 RepID=A0ABS2TXY1_9ACTN|nr:cupin domain-containing protein [Actinacidiphila acididurans]MBM9508194.1 cupin domain-containing protein [Actinacidiphila acididurans]
MNDNTPGRARPQIHKVAAADVSVLRHRGGALRTVLGPANAGATSGFMGLARLEPGEFVNEHYHPYSEEFVLLLSGRITVRLDGEPLELGPREGLLIPVDVRHRLENNGSEAAELVYHLGPLAPRPDLGHVDTEPLPHPDLAPSAVAAAGERR